MVPATKDHAVTKLTIYFLAGIPKSPPLPVKGLYYFLGQLGTIRVISVSMNVKPSLYFFIHPLPARCISLPDSQAMVSSPHGFTGDGLLLCLQTSGSANHPAEVNKFISQKFQFHYITLLKNPPKFPATYKIQSGSLRGHSEQDPIMALI